MKRKAKNGRFCKNQPGAGLRAFHAAGVKQNNLRVRPMALQPLSAGNSTEFSEAITRKLYKLQCRATNLTSFDSLGSCESIYI